MFDNNLFQVERLTFQVVALFFGILIVARFFRVLLGDQSKRRVANRPRGLQNSTRYRRYSNRTRTSGFKHSRNINQDISPIPLNMDTGAFTDQSVVHAVTAPIDAPSNVPVDIQAVVAVDAAVTAVVVGIDNSSFSN